MRLLVVFSLIQGTSAGTAHCQDKEAASRRLGGVRRLDVAYATCPAGSATITTELASGTSLKSCGTTGGTSGTCATTCTVDTAGGCTHAECCDYPCSNMFGTGADETQCATARRLISAATLKTTRTKSYTSVATGGLSIDFRCCEDNTGALCSTIATTDGFCGAGKEYDSTKASSKCKGGAGGTAATSPAAACSSAEAVDVKTCCKTTAGESCTVTASKKDGFCPGGKSYAASLSSNKCKTTTALGGCSSSVLDDTNACCITSTGPKCNDEDNGATADGWCPAGKNQATSTNNNKCKASVADGGCDKDVVDDQKSCCATNTGVKCSEGASAKGWCPSGKSLLSTNKLKCVDSADDGGCSSTLINDQNACCSTNTGEACSTWKEEDGWCSTTYPGYVYDTTKDANKCVKATDSGGCSADDKDDVVACCKTTTIEDHSIAIERYKRQAGHYCRPNGDPNHDMHGIWNTHWPTSWDASRSATDCAAACDADPRCQAFDVNTHSTTECCGCWLLNGGGDPVRGIAHESFDCYVSFDADQGYSGGPRIACLALAAAATRFW